MCSQPTYIKTFGTNCRGLPNAEYVGKNGIYVGCYPALTKEQIEYMAANIREGMNSI
jgi:dTDP-4-amino-4,6-dideoxygalactose transaminase